jgi:diacylglycerol kinase (ATP)
MTAVKILLIFNPNAANGRAKNMLPKILVRFNKLGVDIEILETQAQGHGRELVRQADFNRFDGVVAAGGDGTLFEVINGYYENISVKKIPVGVLPTGTGNAFSRDLDLKSTDWERAIDIIHSNKIKKIDVGHFKSEGREYYFLNILGLGFVSDVSDTAKGLKIFGNTAYLLGVFYQLLFLKTHQLIIELDGQKLERENVFVEISNTRYTGTTFLMAPDAKTDDGLLDITLLNKINRRGILKIFPTIFDGTHVNQEHVEIFKAKKIKIETNLPKVLTPDGEVLGSTPIEVECLKQDVPFFWF